MWLLAWLLYPLTAVLNLYGSYNTCWMFASVAGLVAFVVMMTLLPTDFDPVGIGPRVGRPFVSYLGGLLLTGAVLVIWRVKSKL